MLAAILVLLQTVPLGSRPLGDAPLTAADFFPVVPGTVRSYMDSADTLVISIDEVGAPVDFGGAQATPIAGKDGKKLIGTSYYRVEPNAVYLVGYDPKHPLPQPMPVLEYDGKPDKWSFDGTTSAGTDGDSLHLDGQSKRIPDQEVLGHMLPAIEVTMRATIGVGKNQEHDEQIAVYAKGVGLVQLITKTKVGRRTQSATRRLTKIEEAK